MNSRFMHNLTLPNKRLCINQSKQIHLSSNSRNIDQKPSEGKPRTKLFFVQNPFTWVMTKLDFFMLRRTWDPQFDEKEFCYGCKQAVCAVTQLVAASKWSDVKSLMTEPAYEQFMHTVETEWSDEQRRHMALAEDQIQVAIPRKVRFSFRGQKKRRECYVDMLFIGMRTGQDRDRSIIMIEIQARFYREYSDTDARMDNKPFQNSSF